MPKFRGRLSTWADLDFERFPGKYKQRRSEGKIVDISSWDINFIYDIGFIHNNGFNLDTSEFHAHIGFTVVMAHSVPCATAP